MLQNIDDGPIKTVGNEKATTRVVKFVRACRDDKPNALYKRNRYKLSNM